MRKLMTLMLSLALALPASATMRALPPPCPMDGMTSPVSADEADTGLEESATDCCNDLATAQKTGKACKTGLECGGMASMALPMPPIIPLAAGHVEPATWFQTTPPPAKLSAIWRPPTQI